MIQLDESRLTRIVMDAEASDLTEYAAKELQKYLHLVTGGRLPVMRSAAAPADGEIRVGLSAEGYASDGHDRIRVTASDGALCLFGENAISVLYAVYDFLQAFCGVRFFAPGERFEHVPAQATLRIDSSRLPYENGSAFEIRDFVNRTNSHDVFSFAVKNRVNTILGCGPWVNGSENCSDVNAALIHSFGLKVRGPGHSWKHFVPDASLFSVHPEYFSLLNGRRTVTGRTACFSNPEVQRIFCEKLRAYLCRHPYWDIFAFWAEDLPDYRYCECEECRRKSTTDWYFTLANLAAEVVAEELPHALFEVIAYQGTAEPPKQIRALHDNGRKMLLNCCINQTRDLFRPYAQRTYTNAALFEVFSAWQAWMRETGYQGRFMMMEYYNLCEYPDTGPCGRTLLWPLDVMREDARFYHASGVTAMGAFTGFDRLAFPTPLRLWAWMKLWNNPEQDLDALKADFYACYFGDAAPRIRRYFGQLETLMMQPASDANINAIAALEKYLQPENGFREEVVLCHLRYCVLVKRMYKAYLDGDREAYEAFKKEYLAFPCRHSRLLSQYVAPFPFLWYELWFDKIGWDDHGVRLELRPGAIDMLN